MERRVQSSKGIWLPRRCVLEVPTAVAISRPATDFDDHDNNDSHEHRASNTRHNDDPRVFLLLALTCVGCGRAWRGRRRAGQRHRRQLKVL